MPLGVGYAALCQQGIWPQVLNTTHQERVRCASHVLARPVFSGLPVLIVGVTLATSFSKYVADDHCWLNVQTDIIWAFVGPVLFVLIVRTDPHC